MNKLLQLTGASLLACTACGASAQGTPSSVSLYGLVDLSAGASRPPGGDTTKGIDSGKMTTSYFGFRGTEDLGGGLRAVFLIESYLRGDTGQSGRFDGDNFWARSAYVGLSSNSLGSLRLGRNTTPLFVSTVNFNAFGDSFGYSPSVRHVFSSGTVTGDSGWSDSAVYLSPAFGGVTVSVIGAAGEGNGGRNWGGNITYKGDAFAATAVYQRVEKDGAAGPVDDTRTWQVGASYDFKWARFFGQYGRVDNRSTDTEFRLGGLGASVPIGSGSLLLQWGQLKPDEGPKRNTVSFGYDHFLSKRTDLYLVAMHDKIEDLSAGRSISLGIRHRF
jgi:predicted porin